ncbi:MAG TPA: MlaD family protein [Verrucomicrobiota bacterium]|nr:MCE family protein [Verrucomicrobiales bacterium]HRI12722.1 MlaD family protein [Verrucomicrobiota bacterium]
MKSSLETRLGMFFAVVVLGAFVLFELVGGGAAFKRGVDYRAQFSSAKDLKIGDPVKLAGVVVGRVKSLAVAGTRVEVTLQVDRGTPIRTDSVASIQFTGLMGQNFVALTFGAETAPLAVPGALLQTREQADLGDLMTRLDSVASGVEGLTKSFSGEEISKLFGPLTDFIKQNQSNITSVIQNMQVATTEMAEGRGTFGKLIKDPTLYNEAVNTVTNINIAVADVKPLADDARAMMADMRKLVTRLEQGEGTLGKLMTDEALYTEATGALTNMRQIMEKINQGKGSIGELVNDNAFLKNIKLTLQKVDKATESLEDTGPLSVIGTTVGALF